MVGNEVGDCSCARSLQKTMDTSPLSSPSLSNFRTFQNAFRRKGTQDEVATDTTAAGLAMIYVNVNEERQIPDQNPVQEPWTESETYGESLVDNVVLNGIMIKSS